MFPAKDEPHVQNLSNCCRHRYDMSISQIFFIPFLAGFWHLAQLWPVALILDVFIQRTKRWLTTSAVLHLCQKMWQRPSTLTTIPGCIISVGYVYYYGLLIGKLTFKCISAAFSSIISMGYMYHYNRLIAKLTFIVC